MVKWFNVCFKWRTKPLKYVYIYVLFIYKWSIDVHMILIKLCAIKVFVMFQNEEKFKRILSMTNKSIVLLIADCQVKKKTWKNHVLFWINQLNFKKSTKQIKASMFDKKKSAFSIQQADMRFMDRRRSQFLKKTKMSNGI